MFSIAVRSVMMSAAVASLLFCAVFPADAAGKDPFSAGSMRLSIVVGNGYAFNESYFVAGAGVGYFLANGLELGLEAENWSGGGPHIAKVSPELRYVVPADGAVRPYVGAFYRRTMIEGHQDLNSAGGRAGVYFLSGQGSYFGAGAAYEKYFACNETVYRSCANAYPELIFAIAF